ncbi:26 kDa periplasmic immunogenic protein [Gracilariopsis chorda]|uniref:26 kDa periplasmic immunogenic protein n=1 Tax=Gracilariopsis chorda TaxID=448386 RepID=A0A2V3IQG5_9FLOR|nr:26 kDa periplasmic immunogenic protein [Gracilariopsis chorda]|eukprot:PXF44328.1 26 kDa periplasmic immunogenic protein [Gracilariopsis chorda]
MTSKYFSKTATALGLIFFSFVSTVYGQAIPRTITVSGRGSASAPPDTATINTGVSTVAATAQEALTANNQQFQQVLRVISEQGIEDRDVQTSSFNVNPQFERGPNFEIIRITGYEVSNQVRIIVRDLDQLGQVLDALIAAGSNRVSSVGFSIENNKELLKTARTSAVADATRTAGVLAGAAGVQVGKLIAITDQSGSSLPRASIAAFGVGGNGGVPIATGQLEVSSSVTLQFELINA